MKPRDVARGLAWFGIGLGLAELLAPRVVARASGLQGHERLIQAFGLREIASGALILAAEEPQSWLWTRSVGDVLDGAVLASGMRSNNPDRDRTIMAALAVAPVVALDLAYSRMP